MGLRLVFVDFDRKFGGRAPNASRTIQGFKGRVVLGTPAKLVYTSDLDSRNNPDPKFLWYPVLASSPYSGPNEEDWGYFAIWFRWHGAPRNGGHWRLGDAPMRYLLEDYI